MKRAFTLIELLIVVAIIAILAAIAVPNFLEAQTRSKVSRAKADMRSIATGLESYRVDNNKYAPMADWAVGDAINYWTDFSVAFHSRLPNFITTPISYLTSLPEDIFIPNQNPIPFSNARYPLASRVGYRYVYFNYQQFAEGLPSATSAIRAEITGGWVFYSLGPDKITNQTAAYAPNGVFLRYDPTNGTISEGNIVRTAGSSEGKVQYSAALTGAPNGPN